MGVRLKSFTKEGVETALQQLEKIKADIFGVDVSSLANNGKLLDNLSGKIDGIIAQLKGYVPNSRTVNTLPLTEDIIVTAPLIPYDDDITVFDKIRFLAMPITIMASVLTYADLLSEYPAGTQGQGVIVLQDENHNGDQWLYTWNDDGTGTEKWNATAPFGVNLSKYYTKNDVYNREEITKSQNDQTELLQRNIQSGDAATLSNANTFSVNEVNSARGQLTNVINQSIGNQKSYFDNKIKNETDKLVSKSNSVNGYTLDKDVIIKAMDIPTSDNRTVQNILDAFVSVLNIQGAVENETDLPAGMVNGTGYVVRNGTNYPAGPDGNYPELFVIINRQWQYICRLLVNLDLYYTKSEIDTAIQKETDRAVLAESGLQGDITVETNRAADKENALELRISNEEIRANSAESQLGANIASGDQNTLTQANNYTDGKVEIFLGTLDAKVDKSFPVPLISDIVPAQNSANVTLELQRTNLEGDARDKTITLPVVSDELAGIMTPEDHNQIWINEERLDNLEKQGVYIGQSFPTYADLMAFSVPGYVTENNFTYVLDDENHSDATTKYIWSKEGGATLHWAFAFVVNYDPTENFTNNAAGLIQGRAVDGNIESAGNGFGQVNGWGALKGRVDDVETLAGNNQIAIQGTDGNGGLKGSKVDKINTTAGVASKVQWNEQGQIIASQSLVYNDIPTLDVAKISDYYSRLTAELNKLRIMVS